ncbi:hypothetical protein A4R43_36615 [Amycolatopsis albispora]|uniref:Uncharacterized protein n=1 Tax=Amycolatopsis albispora TaxID=1804986 RepID=A0A344LGX0_9PSEU|nr:hypothetical protein A4R43_36615 [Amycolatopsis albispora]
MNDHDDPAAQLAQALGPLIGQRVPGGCEDCDAYRTVKRDAQHRRMWHVTVHHDDTCPQFRQMR